MSLQLTAHLLVSFIGIATALGCLYWGLINSSEQAVQSLQVFLILVLTWGALQVSELFVDSSLAMWVSFAVRAARALMAIAWFYFTMTYAGYGDFLKSTTCRVISVLGGAYLLFFTAVPPIAAAYTYPDITTVSSELGLVAFRGSTPFRVAERIIGYGFVLIGTAAIAYRFTVREYVSNWRTVVFSGAVVCVILSDGVFNPIGVPGFDYSFIGASLSTALLILSLYRGDLFKYVPVAREYAFRELSDPVLVVTGGNNTIIDANEEGKNLAETAAVVNKRIEDVFAQDVSERICNLEDTESTLAQISGCRYKIKKTEVAAETEPSTHIIRFTDITDEKRREEAIDRVREMLETTIDVDDRQQLARKVVQTTQEAFERPLVGIWIYRDDEHLLEPLAVSARAQQLIDEIPTYTPGNSLSWDAFENNEMMFIQDMSAETDAIREDNLIQSEIIIPLDHHGVLNIGSTDKNAFDDTDFSLAQIIGSAIVSAFDDLERRRELELQQEELRKQNEQLDQFASIISHDLRNPLNVASGRLSLLEQTGDMSHISDIESSLDRIEEIVEKTLTLARQGKSIEKREQIELRATAHVCWEVVETSNAQLEIESTREFLADPDRLKHIFENLYRNSIEHAEGNVTITVGATNNGFYISDDGPGIPDDMKDEIFSPGSSSSDSGPGLGLAIVDEVVQAHDWSVTVTDSAAGGARFEITIEEADMEGTEAELLTQD